MGARLSNRPQGRPPVVGESIVTTVPADSGASIPFIGLAEAYALAAIRRAGVPLQRVRPALDRLRAELGIEHVLASRRLFTDGAEVLYDYAEDHSDTSEARSARELVVVRNDQQVFTETVESYLRRIEARDDQWAQLIHLPKYRHIDVVVDPDRGVRPTPSRLAGRSACPHRSRVPSSSPSNDLTFFIDRDLGRIAL
ncbi:MAG: hypothetical protein JO364_07900 [Pseudonocardiales bacterium]|nr:hypothetical protein [Pseudonocardiales bacterium]